MKLGGIVETAALSLLLIAAACEDAHSAAFDWTTWVGRDDGTYGGSILAIALDRRGNSSVVYNAYEEPERTLKGVVLDVSRVSQVDPGGHLLWQTNLTLPDEPARPIALAIDREDGTVVVGEAYSGPNWIARIDRRGKLTMPPTMFEGLEHPRKIAIDADDNVFVVGNNIGEQPDYPSDIAFAKLSASGEVLWMHTVDTSEKELAVAVAVDAQGGVLVGADVGWPPPEGDIWFQRYDADGVARWNEPVIFKTELNDTLTGLAILPDDSYMAAGASGQDGLGPSSAWIMHFGADGAALWPRPMVLTSTDVQDPFGGAVAGKDEQPTSLPRISERVRKEEEEGRVADYASADAIALDPAGHPVVIGVRNESLWLQHFEPRDGILAPCGDDSQRCGSPTIYETTSGWPNHRSMSIDRDGRVVIVGDPGELAVTEHVGVWLGKLTGFDFSHQHD